MSPSWYNNGLSEEFYILATVPLASVNRPKKDDTEHLRVHSCCWQTRSEAQLVHSCPPWPDLILTFPKLFLEPCYSWPQVWEKSYYGGFSCELGPSDAAFWHLQEVSSFSLTEHNRYKLSFSLSTGFILSRHHSCCCLGSGVSSSCGARGGFLPRHDGQGSPSWM